jgi:excisionase family DNA binding protein
VHSIDDQRLTFTVTEAAGLLGLSKAATYKAINDGSIPVLEIGRRKLIPREALLRMIKGDASVIEDAA